MDYKKELCKILKKNLNEDVENILEVPPVQELGDYALPCFFLAKKLKKDPASIAKDLSRNISAKFIDRIETKGPYLNFFLKRDLLAESVLEEIFKLKDNIGKSKEKKKILLEFPSPNTNKPLHLGHVRNILLGQSLARMRSHLGSKVIKVNLNNDRGIHICKSMLAYQKWGNNAEPKTKSDHFVGDFYVMYNKNETPDLEKEIQVMLQKWEQNDPKVRALWKKMNSWALKGFEITYKKLQLDFDKTYYESETYGKGKEIIYSGVKNGVFFKDNDGSIAVDLEKEGLGRKVLLRADGTSIYITQDIYLAKKKFEDFKPDLSVYIVGSEQNYHFKVLFKVLELLKLSLADKCFHFSYGMVNLPEGKMKSREGAVVDADDIISQMESLAEAEVKKRYKKLSEREIKKRAKTIGMAALRFFILKMDPAKDMVFNPKESISFEGETGPYVQYAYARIQSILRRYNKPVTRKDINVALLKAPESSLIKTLAEFPAVARDSAVQYKPSSIARYLIGLTQQFNSYYDSYPILKEAEDLKKTRLALIVAVAYVIKIGLSLLHIDVLNEM